MSDTTVQPEATAAPEAPRLTRGDLHKSFWRYFWSFQISWNYERMQALGFAWAMQPVLRKLYPDQEQYSEALQRHLVFFNTSPIVGGPLILGTSVAMEEAGQPASAEGVKVGMMGPMAGIGDTLTFALYNSIIFTIGSGWALDGNVMGPIFAALFVLVPYFAVRYWQFFFGYSQGKNLVTRLATGAITKVNEGATILGLVVLGGFIPAIVKMVTTLTYKETVTAPGGKKVHQAVQVQADLDKVLPFLLPVALTGLLYWLLKKFNINPLWLIGFVFVVGLVLGGFGWFAKLPPVAAK